MKIDNDLYQYLKLNGKQPRNTIVQDFGIPRSTIFDALQRLENRNLVKRESDHNQQVGRPQVLFEAIS